MEQDKFAELKEAHKNGAVIECLQLYDFTWFEVENPQWNEDAEYRIKPEEESYDDPYSWVNNSMKEENMKIDIIVQNVVKKYQQRSEVGIKKYNTTLQENSDGIEVFLTHLQEELMDATLYIEKLKQQVKQLKDVI